MPCSNCGNHRIIISNDYHCPECERLTVLDNTTAIIIGTKLRDHFNQLFFDILAVYDKQTLLGNLAAHREEFCRKYFYKYSALDLGKLVAYTILMKKAVEYGIPFGKFADTKEDIGNLVDAYDSVLQIESDLLNIKLRRERILYFENFDVKNLSTDQLLRNFMIVDDDEKNDIIRKIFAKHDLYSSSDGEKKIQEYGSQISADVNQSRSYTKEQFISTFYDLINTFYIGLLRNKLYAENFDLRPFGELMDDPADIMRFVNMFRYLGQDNGGREIQTICKTVTFLNRASSFFNLKKRTIMKKLVFDADNSSIFPLFRRFKNDTLGDVVVISHRFTYFVYTLLHAIITKDLLDLETEKRSKEFETTRVKTEFEKKGYTHIPPMRYGKSALEIDGIVFDNNSCYVIECKSWRLPKLFNEVEKQDQIIRDIKGIIIGEKYTYQKDGKLKTKKIVSIKEKVNFVKNNLAQFGIQNLELNMIRGLVILEDYPPITEFEGVRVLSIEDIKQI